MGWLGGGGPKPYQSADLGDYESATKSGLFNRVGAQKVKNPAYDTAMQDYERQMQRYNSAQQQQPIAMNRAQATSGWYQPPAAPQRPNVEESTYDYSNVGKPVSGGMSGNNYKVGDQQYDFSGINKSIQGFQNPQKYNQNYQSTYNPTLFKETYSSGYNPVAYKPTNFNYGKLPSQYADIAYQEGAKDIRRQGQGDLEKLRETVGVRRPGSLMKAAEQSQKNVGEQLAGLNSQIRLAEMMKNLDLGVQQQQDQAGENLRTSQFGEGQQQFKAGEGYKGYQSRSDIEKAQEQQAIQKSSEDYRGYQSRADQEKAQNDEIYRYLDSLNQANQNSVVTQGNLLQNERNYQDQGLQYLMDILKTNAGAQNQAAQIGAQKQGNFLQFLSGVAKAACLPKDTQIETDGSLRNVQDIKVGDSVKGGKVVAINRSERPEGHKFYTHKFNTGTVIMSDGHPYFDELIFKSESDRDSDATYDILTDSGFYYVNGVKLGSTINT